VHDTTLLGRKTNPS
jgi:hypothetical protein